jgi:MFS family permease
MVSSISSGRWGFAQGITHGASRLGNALAPPLIVTILAYTSWRGAFVILGLFSLDWVVFWAWVTRRDALSRVSPSTENVDETTPAIPWWRLAKRMAPVRVVDFCYGWTLWVFLTWLPSFFLKSFNLNLSSSAFFTGGVLLGGVAGDLVGGFLSDYIYHRTGSLQAARRNVIIAGMLGAFVFLIPVVLTHDLRVVAICLSLACFSSELVVAPIWAVPMDIAPRYAGAASGLMNFGFAGIVSPIVFGGLLDLTGGWTAPFCGSIALLLVGASLALFMHPDRPFELSLVSDR